MLQKTRHASTILRRLTWFSRECDSSLAQFFDDESYHDYFDMHAYSMHLVLRTLSLHVYFLFERGFTPSDPHRLLFKMGFTPSDPHRLLKLIFRKFRKPVKQ